MNLLDRSHSFIMRWSSRPDMGQRENLAEHMGWVTRLSMIIGHLVEKEFNLDWKKIYEIALTHDDPELLTGDISGQFKRLNPHVRDQLRSWEIELLDKLYKDLPSSLGILLCDRFFQASDHSLEAKIVKLADIIAALAYAKMQTEMGNTLFNQIEKDIFNDTLEQISSLLVSDELKKELTSGIS